MRAVGKYKRCSRLNFYTEKGKSCAAVYICFVIGQKGERSDRTWQMSVGMWLAVAWARGGTRSPSRLPQQGPREQHKVWQRDKGCGPGSLTGIPLLLCDFCHLLPLSLPGSRLLRAFPALLLSLIRKCIVFYTNIWVLAQWSVGTFSWKDFAWIFHCPLPWLALGKLHFFFPSWLHLPLTLLKTGIKTLDSCLPHKIFK